MATTPAVYPGTPTIEQVSSIPTIAQASDPYALTKYDADGNLTLSDYYADRLGHDAKSYALGLWTLGLYAAAKHMADCYRWGALDRLCEMDHAAKGHRGRCHNPLCMTCGKRWCRLGSWLYDRSLESLCSDTCTLIELIDHRPAGEPDVLTPSHARIHRDAMMDRSNKFTDKLGMESQVCDVIDLRSREIRANILVRGQVSYHTAKRLWPKGWIKVTVGTTQEEIKHLLGILFSGLEPCLILDGHTKAQLFLALKGCHLSRTPRKSDYFRPLPKSQRIQRKQEREKVDIMCPCDECKGKVPMVPIPPSERKIERVEDIEKRYDKVIWDDSLNSPWEDMRKATCGILVHKWATNEQVSSKDKWDRLNLSASPPN